MTLVVALGGNALLRRGEALTAENQQRNLERAADSLAALAADHDLVLVHGNGPQVGLLALEADAFKEVPPYPLDILGAESQGMIGYMILQALTRRLPDREMVCVLTRTLVDPNDPALASPGKPIGPVYDAAQAKSLARERGWSVAADGEHWRRVVPSPTPVAVLEQDVIAALRDRHAVVICAGGGGVPVCRNAQNAVGGIEAVVDKDQTASLLARGLDANGFMILTDVDGVYDQWDTPDATLIRHATVEGIRSRSFPAGSMGPKIDAVCRYVETTGRSAGIGAMEQAQDVLAGTSGTRITAADGGLRQ